MPWLLGRPLYNLSGGRTNRACGPSLRDHHQGRPMTEESEARRVPIDRLERFIERAFTAVGMPAGDARTVASLMAEADALGSEGHGVFRLPQYVRRIRAGGVNLHPNIRIEHERAGMALLNGDNAMGHLVMRRAAELAAEKAAAAGISWGGAPHSNHAR